MLTSTKFKRRVALCKAQGIVFDDSGENNDLDFLLWDMGNVDNLDTFIDGFDKREEIELRFSELYNSLNIDERVSIFGELLQNLKAHQEKGDKQSIQLTNKVMSINNSGAVARNQSNKLENAIVEREAQTVLSLASFKGAITNQKTILQAKLAGTFKLPTPEGFSHPHS